MSSKRGGFTLVEILIVVVILGILAAIVIPQFTNASESAKASSLVTQLQTIRSQLELAQVQHQGAYPDLINNGWTPLITVTEPDAAYSAGGTDSVSGNEVGPYLQQAPANPFEGGSTSISGTEGPGVGWVFDVANNTITANMSSAKATELGLDANTVTAY